MTVAEIVRQIDREAPFAEAEPWDNVGLLVGAPEQEVSRALVCLDITEEVIRTAIDRGATLILSHHPVIFDALSSLAADSLPYKLAQAGIAAIAAHTNLDKAEGGVNDRLLHALGLVSERCDASGLCRLARLPEATSPQAFAAFVGERLQTAVRLHAGDRPVHTVAVVGGAGGDYVKNLERLGADALVTGEVKHHEWLAAGSYTLVDAGHAATERVVVRPWAERLRQELPQVEWIACETPLPYVTLT